MENDKEWLLCEDESTPKIEKTPRHFPKARENVLLAIIIILIFLNALQLSITHLQNWQFSDLLLEPPSHVAGLLRNLEIPKYHDTLFSVNSNLTHRDQLWESIDITRGIVALDQDFIRAQRLPLSMEFPWEENKRVYSTTAHHQLHCLKKLYKSVSESFEGQNQTENVWHLMHCLDSLRQDALCNADDTLFYTFERSEHSPQSGDGQTRLCRNFSALEEWTKPLTACYAFSESSNSSINEKGHEHFRRCPIPEGEKYLPQLREHFGVGDAWVPDYSEY